MPHASPSGSGPGADPGTEKATTTPELVHAAAAEFGERIFIREGDRDISFRQFLELTRTAAAALVAGGFNAGEKAAIWAPNCQQWAIAALAIQYCGGTLVTLNTRFKGSEAATVLNASGASVLFCAGNFLDTDYPALLKDQSLPSLRELVLFQEADSESGTDWQDFLTRGEAFLASEGSESIDAIATAVAADSPSDILFTSGTTGTPKGVITSHGQNLMAFRTWADVLGLDVADRYLAINPFFHTFGYKAGILTSLMKGATLYPWQVFDVQAVLDFIQREQITLLPGPPTIFQSLLSHPERENYDLASLRKAITGAASIPVKLITDMQSVLGIETVLTAYGLSECCGLATMCRRGDAAEVIANTSGRAIPDVEVLCAAEDGSEVPRGEPGEILVRGYNVMAGYLDNPQATAEAIDTEGWLHTGDIGVMDEQGNLSITDRLKDMFITGGFNCYPAEIENLLCSHGEISMAAVIGVADERLGEVAMAWIVTRSGEPIPEEDIRAWCRENMANYKVPRLYEFVDSLPTNASGKVVKAELRERFRLRKPQTTA